MKVPIAAFFARSLRVGCRVKSTYTLRLLMAAVILLTLVAFNSNSSASAPGLAFFAAMTYISLAFLILLGLGFFATVITEEREEMTLGLLKMTGLSSISILLGKSVSRLLDALLIILAQVPFVLLAITLGGVSLLQIAAGLVSILAWAVLLSGLGLLCSVCFQRSENASKVMALVVLLFLLAPLCSYLFDVYYTIEPLETILRLCLGLIVAANPFLASVRIMETGFSGPLAAEQVWLDLIAGAVLFLLAWACFEVFTGEERAAAPSRRQRFRKQSLSGRRALRKSSGRRQFWISRAWSQWALGWKDFYFVCGGPLKATIRLLIYAGLGAAILLSGLSSEIADFGPPTMFISFLLGAFYFAFHLQLSLQSEIKQHTLAAIILLPISPRAILLGKLCGCLLALMPELLFFCLGVAMAPSELGELIAEIALPDLLRLLVQGALGLHLLAFFSLAAKRRAIALGLTILTWIGSGLLLSLIGLLDIGLILMVVVLNFEIVRRFRAAAAWE